MKIGYLRVNDDYTYLIPENLIEEFEGGLSDLESIEEYSDDWYCFLESFNSKFSEYIVECTGNLKVIIEN